MQNPPRKTLTLGETHSASIGVLVMFLLKVAGGEDAECWDRIESLKSRFLSFSASLPVWIGLKLGGGPVRL